MNLLDVLSSPSPTEMSLLTARVALVPVDSPTRVDLIVGEIDDEDSMQILGAGYLDGYTPVVGDVVCVLAKQTVGALVLGKLAGSP